MPQYYALKKNPKHCKKYFIEKNKVTGKNNKEKHSEGLFAALAL